MSIKEEKHIRRRKYRLTRKLEVDKYNHLICSNVIDILQNRFSNNKRNGYIGIYWPIKGEVDLRILKDQQEFLLALPSCNLSKEINYHPWTNNRLQKDIHGIPSPLNNKILKPEQIKLLLVPALAIDKRGYRLGYGGGYFDRLRSKCEWEKIKALLVLPEACISSENLPVEEWDIPFDGCISEKGLYQVKR